PVGAPGWIHPRRARRARARGGAVGLHGRLVVRVGWPRLLLAPHRDRRGPALANVYTGAPATLAQCAAGVADVAPGRFILGLGSGSQVIIEKWNGGRFDKPAPRVRQMVLFLAPCRARG